MTDAPATVRPYDGSAHRALCENRDRYFWQSRANLRDPPELVDLRELARDVRRGPN